jgi:hypothetical protein
MPSLCEISTVAMGELPDAFSLSEGLSQNLHLGFFPPRQLAATQPLAPVAVVIANAAIPD